ncbi:MAG: ATP synthase subunit delta [Gemmatimonadaceae bacterium]|nr:ATP synthase subunit delta [Gemmatimonadaceae bacterium]
MRDTTIARNYAEALMALAQQARDLDGWGASFNRVADAVQTEPRLRNFLAAPQVAAAEKNAVLEKAFASVLPHTMLRFLQKLVLNRRQMLIPEIAVEYGNLVDQTAGRLHAQVTVAREVTDSDRSTMAAHLGRTTGKTVVPHIHVNPAILGGVIVRIGDHVMDGSVRKRLSSLRSRMASGAR